MKVESHEGQFLDRIERQVVASFGDAADFAARQKGAPSDTRDEVTGPFEGRIGSSRPYAKAQERGAYIVPKRRRALQFRSGEFRMRARLPANRYLAKAAARWGDMLAARLRGG